MMLKVNVLRVVNSSKNQVKLGSKHYQLDQEKDKVALLETLKEPFYVAKPLVVADVTTKDTLFHWLMNNGVDMDNAYFGPLHAKSAIPYSWEQCCIEEAVQHRNKVMGEIDLTEDDLLVSALVRKVLLDYYKAYYRREVKKYAEKKELVQAKMSELLPELNRIYDTDYTQITEKQLHRLVNSLKLSEFTREEVITIKRKLYRLCMYLEHGFVSSFRLGLSKRLLVWHDVCKLKDLVPEVCDALVDESKYFEVTLSSFFPMLRYYTGQSTQEFAADILGIKNVDFTKGYKNLREQEVDVDTMIKSYMRELHAFQKSHGILEFNREFIQFMLSVVDAVERDEHVVRIVDISDSVTFAFSNHMAVSKVIKILRDILELYPNISRLFDSVSVYFDDSRKYVPIQKLLTITDEQLMVYPNAKSRHCAKDFLYYLNS